MKKGIAFQLKNAFYSRNFTAVCAISTLFGIVCFVIKCVACFGNDIINIPSAYQQFFANARANDEFVVIFAVAAPFLIAAAFSDSFITEEQNRYSPICLIREGKNTYYFSKLIAVFCCGALTVVLPQLINFLLCLIAFPLESTYLYTWDLWQADIYTVDMSNAWFLFKELYVASPYLYFICFILISGIIAGVLAVLSYQISFFIKNRIFVTSFMFVFINLSTVLFETYMISYNITNCMFGLSVSNISYSSFLITCGIYLAAAALLTPLSLRRLRNCV